MFGIGFGILGGGASRGRRGPSAPALNAPTASWSPDATPQEGDSRTALIDVHSEDGSTASEVHALLNGVKVGDGVHDAGDDWEFSLPAILLANSGNWTFRKITDLGNRTSAVVPLTVEAVTVTLAASDTTPNEGDDIDLSVTSNYGTINSATFLDGDVELAVITEAPFEHTAQDITPGVHNFRVVVTCDESGDREIEDTETVTAAAEAPTLDAPLDEAEITEGDDAVSLEASGTVDGFDDNTVQIDWYAEPAGGGTPVLLDSDSDASGGWTGTWDASALTEGAQREVYARRTYSLHQGGTATIDSARATVEIVSAAVAPTPTLTSPTEGQIFVTGEIITLAASVPSDVDKVQFIVDMPGVGEVVTKEIAHPGPYTFDSDPVDTDVFPPGDYEIWARAVIGSEHADSEHVTITITDKIWERITGHAAAWRSDLGITLNDSTVSAWASQGGTVGGSVQQASATNQPSYIASDSDLGGLPSLEFSSDWLDSDAAPSAWNFLHDGTGCTVLAVVRVTGGSTYVISATSSGSSSRGWQLQHIGASNRIGVIISDGASNIIVAHDGSAAPEPGNYAVLTYHRTASTPDCVVEYPIGTVQASASGTPSASNAAATLRMGGRPTGGFLLPGKKFEEVYWPFELDSTQRALVAAYVNARYGL